MRLVIDSLIAVLLVLLLGAVLVHYRQEQAEILQYQLVHQALSEMQEQALLHGALEEVETNEAKFPVDILTEWFDNGPPRNALISAHNPWLDVAPPGDKNDQPPDPVIHDRSQAGFWYNPNRGTFRARVAPQFTETATLELYNELNGTSLRSLPRPADPYPATHLAGVTPKASESQGTAEAQAHVKTPPIKRTLLDQDPLR